MKTKSNKKIILESMAARIRELETQVEKQGNTNDAINSLNTSLIESFARYFTDKGDAAQLLEFERHIDKLLLEYDTILQPDVLYAYLGVFETVKWDDLLDNDNIYDDNRKANVNSKIKSYQEQLQKWVDGGRES